MSTVRVTYAIIGAGFAGVSLAYHLLKKGAKGVLLMEQEPLPGQHASGRNAGMIRQVVFDDALARLVYEGARFLNNLPSGWPDISFRRCGSLLLAKGERLNDLEKGARLASSFGVELSWFSKREVAERIPILQEGDFEKALFCPSDGVVSIQALLQGYLSLAKEAGLTFLNRTAPFEVARQGKIFRLKTRQETVEADVLVNAAGAWATEVAASCGASRIPLNPCRRHLFFSEKLSKVSADWPFIWDVNHNFYFRPELGGLLLSPCDEDPMAPGDCPVEPAMQQVLLQTLKDHLPSLSGCKIVRGIAGLRTLTPDGRFVIGFDPAIENLFWIAGLGGHGVTASSSVGDLASDLLLGRPHDAPFARYFSPKRFTV